MRRYVSLLLVVPLLALSACGDDDEGGEGAGGGQQGQLAGTSITFSISLDQAEQAAIDDLVRQFESRTGADVTVTAITSSDLPGKLRVDVGAGRPTVHLFAQDNLALAVLVQDNLVEDLSDVQVPPEVLTSMTPERFNGRQYFLPFRPNVRVAYVNSDRFRSANARPPTTTEEYRTVAQTLRNAGGGPKVTMSLAQGDPAAVTISEWIVAFGGNPLILNDDGSVRAFEFIQGMWRDGLLARESLLGKFDTEPEYLIGETAWLAQNWPVTSAQLNEQGLLGRFDVYEGPRGPARAAHVIGGDVLGIPRGVSPEQRRAAVELAQFLVSKQAQETLAERNAWPSVRSDAYGRVPTEQKETFDAVQKALESGWYRPNVVYWSDVSEQMNAAIRRTLEGNENVRTVLDELHGRIEAAARQKGAQYPPTS
ncbi:MAG TPA: extracellular solute-binding protein [Acidimicrobiales bacterium]|nr:extracellular solute-binding protein [Acidimicrobiales bacterium]